MVLCPERQQLVDGECVCVGNYIQEGEECGCPFMTYDTGAGCRDCAVSCVSCSADGFFDCEYYSLGYYLGVGVGWLLLLVVLLVLCCLCMREGKSLKRIRKKRRKNPLEEVIIDKQ
jgi:hypothetical protein